MIRITVTGHTWEMRKCLKENKFRWNPANKTWVRIVGEGSLDKTINAIRPPRSWSDVPDPEIRIIMQKVDIEGNLINPTEVKILLRSVARPGGDSVLERLSREMGNKAVSKTSYHQYASPPGPTNSDDDEEGKERKKQKSLEGFF